MKMLRPFLGTCLAGLALLALFPAPARALSVNDKLPKFSCATVEGAHLSSTEFAGKVLAICFTSSWVKRAGDELRYLQGLGRELKDKDLVVLPVIEREDKAHAAEFASRLQLTTRICLDNGSVARLFGVNGLPALFIIDRAGVVRQRLIGYGPASPESIRKIVVPLLAEAKPVKADPKQNPAPPTPAPSDLPPPLLVYAHLKLGAAHIDIGDAFINAGQRDGGHYAEAIKEFRAGLALEPRNVNLLVWLAVANERKGDLAEAVRFYQAALDLDPENSYARDSLRRLRALPPVPLPPPPTATPPE